MKKFFRIIPVIIMGIILLISSAIFAFNKKQTYERIKNLEEDQVRIIAEQVDARIQLTGQTIDSSPESAAILKKSVERINEQSGVYCYLFDENYNLVSNLNEHRSQKTREELMQALKDNTDDIKVLISHEYHGYVSAKSHEGREFLVYWQGLPSGIREDCHYYIILCVAEDELQDNEAVLSCKAMIGILTIMLGISIYGNIYIPPVFNENTKTKMKK